MSAYRLLVVDDFDLVRDVICAMLRAEDDFDVVGQATGGSEAIDLAAKFQPDVVLLDLAMPEMDGLEALPKITEAAPATRVVVLSGFGTDQAVAAAMASGATAFLHKAADLYDNLVPTLRRVLDQPDADAAQQESA